MRPSWRPWGDSSQRARIKPNNSTKWANGKTPFPLKNRMTIFLKCLYFERSESFNDFKDSRLSKANVPTMYNGVYNTCTRGMWENIAQMTGKRNWKECSVRFSHCAWSGNILSEGRLWCQKVHAATTNRILKNKVTNKPIVEIRRNHRETREWLLIHQADICSGSTDLLPP